VLYVVRNLLKTEFSSKVARKYWPHREDAAPDGAWRFFLVGCYKYVAPTVPALASEGVRDERNVLPSLDGTFNGGLGFAQPLLLVVARLSLWFNALDTFEFIEVAVE
jgi:hypothetical protein